MKTQLIQLSTLLRLLDSEFCSYLGKYNNGKQFTVVLRSLFNYTKELFKLPNYCLNYSKERSMLI